MRHISTSMPWEGGKSLAAMHQWSGPNLVCFTRAAHPPIATLSGPPEPENDDADSCEESAPGTKRALRGMSVKSSLGVARVLSTLDWVRLGRCLHCTLTYWKSWPRTKREILLAKKSLGMWFSRNVDSGVWRLEFQSRTKPESHKVPHWHVLAFIGFRDPDSFMGVLRAWWAQTDWGNSHEQGCHFSPGDGRASWYLAMHAGKRDQAPPFEVGRWWGFINRRSLLAGQRFSNVGETLERERVWWSRLYRRRTGCKVRNAGGFSWFLSEGGQERVRQWVAQHIPAERRARSLGAAPF